MMACKIDETTIRMGPVDFGLTIFGVTPGGGAMAGSSSSDAGREVIFKTQQKWPQRMLESFQDCEVELQRLATFQGNGG